MSRTAPVESTSSLGLGDDAGWHLEAPMTAASARWTDAVACLPDGGGAHLRELRARLAAAGVELKSVDGAMAAIGDGQARHWVLVADLSGELDAEAGFESLVDRLLADAETLVTAHGRRSPPGAPIGRVVLMARRDAFGLHGMARSAARSAACLGLTRSLALDYASRGATVNAVVLGSEGAQGAMPGRDEVRDAVEGVLFLADPRSRYITGQTLQCCSGQHLYASMTA